MHNLFSSMGKIQFNSLSTFKVVRAVIALSFVLIVFQMEYSFRKEGRQEVANLTVFLKTADQAAEEVLKKFKRWQNLTSENNEIYEWSGSAASILGVEKRICESQRTAHFVVWAVTPNERYFTVTFEMDKDLDVRLSQTIKFREMAVDDVVRKLNTSGRTDLIQKSHVVRSPA